MAEPKRIQVRDRFITVLELIQAVDGYYYTPDFVTEKPIEYAKNPGKIRLIAYTDEGGAIENHSGAVDETFYIAVEGWVEDMIDPNKKAERVIQDVRKAIDADAKNPSAGYLGGLCLQVVMDESAEVDNEMATEGINRFFQKFRCMITGADFSGL